MRTRLVLAFLFMAPIGGIVAAEEGSIPFRLRDASDIVVEVTVAGQGPFRFLLDTGSTRSAVTVRVAGLLGLAPAGQTLVMTPTGQVRRPLVEVEIAVAALRTNLRAMVVPQQQVDPGIDGIVGTDLLSARTFMIDYVARRIRFESGARPVGGTSIPLTHGIGGFVAAVPVDAVSQPLRLVPDTGTSTVVLFAGDRGRSWSATPLSALPARSAAGIAVGRAVMLDALRIGTIEIRNQPAVLMPRPDASVLLGDGLLPLHLFARVLFDPSGGQLTIVPRH